MSVKSTLWNHYHKRRVCGTVFWTNCLACAFVGLDYYETGSGLWTPTFFLEPVKSRVWLAVDDRQNRLKREQRKVKEGSLKLVKREHPAAGLFHVFAEVCSMHKGSEKNKIKRPKKKKWEKGTTKEQSS